MKVKILIIYRFIYTFVLCYSMYLWIWVVIFK